MAKIKVIETETNKLIIAALEKIGCYVWRNNTGVARDGGRYIRYGLKGSSDIIGVAPDGHFIAVENKTGGKPMSKDQTAFFDRVQDKGGYVYVVESIDDIRSLADFIKYRITYRAAHRRLPSEDL